VTPRGVYWPVERRVQILFISETRRGQEVLASLPVAHTEKSLSSVALLAVSQLGTILSMLSGSLVRIIRLESSGLAADVE
jgi:hypothetical protein